jgi:hypothetical protein
VGSVRPRWRQGRPVVADRASDLRDVGVKDLCLVHVRQCAWTSPAAARRRIAVRRSQIDIVCRVRGDVHNRNVFDRTCADALVRPPGPLDRIPVRLPFSATAHVWPENPGSRANKPLASSSYPVSRNPRDPGQAVDLAPSGARARRSTCSPAAVVSLMLAQPPNPDPPHAGHAIQRFDPHFATGITGRPGTQELGKRLYASDEVANGGVGPMG